MRFSFQAKNIEGKDLSGTREAVDRFALARDLRAEGWILILAEEVDLAKEVKGEKTASGRFFGRIKLREKILFVNNLGAMVGAGLPLARALATISRQAKNKSLKTVVEAIGEKIDHGSSLSAALEDFPGVFPEIFVAMIGVAEESGRLPETLKLLGEQLEKSYDLRRKISGAMIYPAIIVSVIIIVGFLMLIFLIPTLATTFRELNVPLPFSTRLVIGLSDFISNNLLICLALLALAAGGFYSLIKTHFGQRQLDRIILHLPVVGNLSREFNSAAIMRTLSSLISSGVSMVDSLHITHKTVDNVFYREWLANAAEKVQKGVTLGALLSERPDLFPVFAIEMTSVGEETGKLPEMLLRGAEFFESEVDQATKNLSTIIEPVLMVLIGIAVGFFAVSMLGPMYSLSSAIK